MIHNLRCLLAEALLHLAVFITPDKTREKAVIRRLVVSYYEDIGAIK